MTASAPAASPAPPQFLLAHHLRQLKLPTFLREYEKLAAEAAREGLDHVRFLLRLAELELIDRERRIICRRRAWFFSARLAGIYRGVDTKSRTSGDTRTWIQQASGLAAHRRTVETT